MAKRKLRRRQNSSGIEPDGAFVLKLVAYLIAGSLWLRINKDSSQVSLPLGFMVALLFTRHEKFQIDRKIEYAVLLMALFLGFWLIPGIAVIW